MNGFPEAAIRFCRDFMRLVPVDFSEKGLGNSTQKITTIPEAQNDMIFSIICEELGIFGALLVLLLFGYLLYRLFVVAQNAPDAYGMLMVSGVFAHISIQVILNLCVVLKLMPATELPFHLSVTEEHRCSLS